MDGEPDFRSDLYRGTAAFYEEFRLPYPATLLDDVCRRTGATGAGRLLDLACGTGQLAFGLASRFAGVVAVDQEPEAIDLARAKADVHGVRNIRWIAGPAEDVDAGRDFDLVVIGNAFHRLHRRRMAEAAYSWLVPGGHLALVWSRSPWDGDGEWQRVLTQAMRDWIAIVDAEDRVPAGLDRHFAEQPHSAVLAEAGFTIVDEHDFPTPHEWTVERLIGFLYSTSVLSRPALGEHTDAFEHDVRARLLQVAPDNSFRESIDFGYTLARRP